MRTNPMIYQAATAHQADLRRAASERRLTGGRSSSPAAWTRLLAFAGAQRRHAQAAAQATASGITVERFSI